MATPHRAASLLLLFLLCLATLLSGHALGAAVSPSPFAAHYRLEVSGWPDASIEHRLSREGHYWLSEMHGAIAVARGKERSRFTFDEQGVQPLLYASGYSLLGLGGQYHLAREELSGRPDRQSALFELARRALNGACEPGATCRLEYQDHRGRDERLDYTILPREQLSLPAGEFEAVRVEGVDPEKPDRRLVFSFHPELPGLLLDVAYHRDGQRQSRLTLTALERPSS